ncbi:MAG TPA: hypothetical protein ENJ21_05120 [Chromatiaceae bacterium]|nr:hypothetical protein [Chromatiaceae bacterium]
MTFFRSLILLLASGMLSNALAGDLTAIATRGLVGTGDDAMIAGFEIQGSEPQTVLIVAAGPSLADANVPNVLADPKLTIHSGSAIIASNNDWGNNAEIAKTGKAPTRAEEAAVILTLAPGSYTAVVTGENGATGNGAVAVYDVASLSRVEPGKAGGKLTGKWTGIQSYTINGQQCRWRLEITFGADNSFDYTRNLIDDEINRYQRDCTVNAPETDDKTGNVTVVGLPDRSFAGDYTYGVSGDTIKITQNPWPQDFSWPSIGTVSFDGEQRAAVTSTIDVDGLFIEFRLDLTRS